jgi:geranylgeranyl pyrophosphate synthase
MTGKSAASDILSKKKSLPVLYGLSASPELARLYADKPQFDADDVDTAVRLLDAVDARRYTQQRESQFYQGALTALAESDLTSAATADLTQLAGTLFGRAY